MGRPAIAPRREAPLRSDTVLVRRLLLYTDPPFEGSGVSLRRAVTAALPDVPLLHNHVDGPRVPLVRYSARQGIAELTGIGEGVPLLDQVRGALTFLVVGSRSYRIQGAELFDERLPFGVVDHAVTHRFITPWLALNERNHVRYQSSGPQERQRLLEAILVGNLLSLSKAVGHHEERRIAVRVEQLVPIVCHHKGVKMLGFRGSFAANFAIPSALGVGKLTSKGFGKVETVPRFTDTEELCNF